MSEKLVEKSKELVAYEKKFPYGLIPHALLTDLERYHDSVHDKKKDVQHDENRVPTNTFSSCIIFSSKHT